MVSTLPKQNKKRLALERQFSLKDGGQVIVPI